MNSQKSDVPRPAAVLLAALALLSSAIAAGAPPRGRGDEFHASRAAPAQTDAAVCRDPQIARIEQETGTQARVFDYRASGTASGQLGGALEARGLVETTGVCLGKPNAVVMFIADAKVAAVDNVTNEFFASSAGGGSPAGSNSGGTYGGEGGGRTVLSGGVETTANGGRPIAPSGGGYRSQYDRPPPIAPQRGRLSTNPQPPVRLKGNANTGSAPQNNLFLIKTSVPTRDKNTGRIYSASVDITVDNTLPLNLSVNINLARSGASKWKAARGQLVRQKTNHSSGEFLLDSISTDGIVFQPVNQRIMF